MTEPQSVTTRATGAETIGASALGGAALGSVAGIAAGIGTLFLPILGTAAGAISGAALGWLASRVAAKGRAQTQGTAPDREESS